MTYFATTFMLHCCSYYAYTFYMVNIHRQIIDVPLSRDEDVFPGTNKVLQRLHMVLLILGSLDEEM